MFKRIINKRSQQREKLLFRLPKQNKLAFFSNSEITEKKKEENMPKKKKTRKISNIKTKINLYLIVPRKN
jgi:hypothetical protein